MTWNEQKSVNKGRNIWVPLKKNTQLGTITFIQEGEEMGLKCCVDQQEIKNQSVNKFHADKTVFDNANVQTLVLRARRV